MGEVRVIRNDGFVSLRATLRTNWPKIGQLGFLLARITPNHFSIIDFKLVIKSIPITI